MIRKKCLKKEHKFQTAYIGAPYAFCRRFRCDASAVSIYAPPALAVALHHAIPRENRFPPVELNADGTVKEEF